jgi:hypothetical protein
VRIIGAAVGNIIATIMTTQVARNSGQRMPMVGDAITMPISALLPCIANIAQAAAARASSRARIKLR